ncbi:WxL domain-containing protein [Enterococcus dongliensis]|uniref:WxL domain-containing protein n=1 Tax=Enterococcus dongliensis TaxID=2559925 RepID=A0AAW8THN2_9ENTE|nr:WxL domain-containing protein [Enterococcus dongliensis]MDT2595666.1 WxL domain-containing protein [Enterococcus dongliensis]MDT2602626.1 WxL domain-containing protein [Enterococcus dongliensis]MDT2633886.1 WxL domain-containing protein [Enterococcus dongliensis]MDT2636278.1 WxL domain-containing protein [Enterococcus dongliensis]MDT2641500.1 WxL domain-containing protein [Enterococcus dongliensis]
MKNKIIGAMLLSTVLLSSFAVTPALAVGTATSKGDITFTEPTGPVDPVKPTDPTKPVEPADPTNPGTGQSGPLSLDVVPTLPFGTHEIGNGTQTYTVDGSKNATPYLQVSDRRGVGTDGQAQGWNVTVKVSDFKKDNQILEGAELNFGASEIKTVPENTSAKPASAEIENLSMASGATSIFSADKDQGLGTWLSVYDPANISLTVPEAAVGTFTADLTWDLTAGPDGTPTP